MIEPDLAKIGAELSVARERLSALQSGRDGVPGTRGVGSDAGQRVRVTVENGRLTSVEFLKPRVLRLPQAELADLLVGAVNAALDLATPVQHGAGVDAELVAGQFRQVQDEALGSLHRTMSTLDAAVRQLRQEAHVAMPAGVPDFERLFALTEQSLAAIRGDAAELDRRDEPRGEGGSEGEGESDGRRVRAVVAPGERLRTLVIDVTATRRPSADLAELVVSAVNRAFDDLHERQREQRVRIRRERAERSEKVRAIQDLGVAEMRTFCDAMVRLMRSIRPNSQGER